MSTPNEQAAALVVVHHQEESLEIVVEPEAPPVANLAGRLRLGTNFCLCFSLAWTLGRRSAR